MMFGIAVFFGMILGGMASMLTNFDAQRARYTHRLNVIKQSLVSMHLVSFVLSMSFDKSFPFLNLDSNKS